MAKNRADYTFKDWVDDMQVSGMGNKTYSQYQQWLSNWKATHPVDTVNSGIDAGTIGKDINTGNLVNVDPSQTQDVVTQEPLRTAEQKEAAKLLLEQGKTGNEYTGSLGSYTMTPTETAGQSGLYNLIQAGLPEEYATGMGEFSKLLSTDQYNPYSDTGVYKGLKRNVQKEYDEGISNLKNSMAYSGNLYSTDINRQAGKLGEAGANKLSDMLASLYQDYGNQRLTGASTLARLSMGAQNMKRTNALAGIESGGLSRNLTNAEANAKYTEWQRNQGSKLSALTSVLGGNSTWGVTSLPIQQQEEQSDWEKLLSYLGQLAPVAAYVL